MSVVTRGRLLLYPSALPENLFLCLLHYLVKRDWKSDSAEFIVYYYIAAPPIRLSSFASCRLMFKLIKFPLLQMEEQTLIKKGNRYKLNLPIYHPFQFQVLF